MPLGVPMGFFSRFAQQRRQQMFDAFWNSMQPEDGETCVELGGPIYSASGVAQRFDRYLVVNIDRSAFRMVNELPHYEKASLLQADAACIPLKDDAVDYVLSNALLEHIPGPLRRSFAREVNRVARKGYFISTPNFWFPLEPHYYMPFFQFLPERLKKWTTKRVRIGWIDEKTYEPISLATTRELRRLFPQAHITGLSFNPLVPETIIAWRRL